MNVYSVSREHTNPRFALAFAKGCGAPVVGGDYRGGVWAGFGSPVSWPSLMAARKAGSTWYYGDHGYFGRGHYYRITRNAFQHEGRGASNPTRQAPAVASWRKAGRHILVCPPDVKIAILMGFDADAWLSDVQRRLRDNSDRPVKIRPRTMERQRPLLADLDNSWALVTWGSNAAVEALMLGVPVFCTGDCAAAVMGRSDPINIEYPRYPDGRDEWASVLASNQWTMEEIASGMAWETLREEV